MTEDRNGFANQVRDLVQELTVAYLTNDTDTLNRIYADDFIYCNYLGEVMNKSKTLADVPSGDYDLSWHSDEIHVRVFGDTAVVTSLETVRGQHRELDISGQYRLMLVCVRRNGAWQLVAGQETRVNQS